MGAPAATTATQQSNSISHSSIAGCTAAGNPHEKPRRSGAKVNTRVCRGGGKPPLNLAMSQPSLNPMPPRAAQARPHIHRPSLRPATGAPQLSATSAQSGAAVPTPTARSWLAARPSVSNHRGHCGRPPRVRIFRDPWRPISATGDQQLLNPGIGPCQPFAALMRSHIGWPLANRNFFTPSAFCAR